MAIDPNDARRKPQDKRTEKSESVRSRGEPPTHRLRGEELDTDFTDAEADSCIVAPKRDQKESDS